MSNVVISVENLSKAYRLGQIGTGRLNTDLKVWWAKVRGKPNPLYKVGQAEHGNRDGETIWALKEMNFNVEQGEALGIIGKNGAGKSTLLKILSRVTAPTGGHARVRGRIASLLEVGTGFHPDLTGRENIYLNGAILGMTRREVRSKFDEIVDFSGVDQYIDTPVKRYSSGMYVRLAFAVAAHLDPEILVVDEVLAVGDAEFQKKCLGKMGNIANEGRTVLFVSHNMAAIENLCSRSILIKKGSLEIDGPSSSVVEHYIKAIEISELQTLADRKDRTGNGKLRFTGFEAITSSQVIRTGKSVRFRLHYSVDEIGIPLKNVAFSFSINTLNSNHLLVFSTEETHNNIACISNDGYFDCMVPFLPLAGGTYGINLYVTVNGLQSDYVQNAARLIVDDADYYTEGGSKNPLHPTYVTDHRWDDMASENASLVGSTDGLIKSRS